MVVFDTHLALAPRTAASPSATGAARTVERRQTRFSGRSCRPVSGRGAPTRSPLLAGHPSLGCAVIVLRRLVDQPGDHCDEVAHFGSGG